MKNAFQVALYAAIASLFSLAIGAGDLRITLGIIVLIVALHANRELDVMSTAFITGVAVFMMRGLVDVIVTKDIDLPVLGSYLLEIFFYLGYGFFYKYLVLNEKNEEGTSIFLLFLLSDFGANTLEYLVRYMFYEGALMQADFVSIFLAAFVRSALIWLTLRYVYDARQLRTPV